MVRIALFLLLAIVVGVAANSGGKMHQAVTDGIASVIVPLQSSACDPCPAAAQAQVALRGSASNEPEQVDPHDGALLDGVPGSGQLSIDELEAWLNDPANHRVLELVLPVGLDGGALDVSGTDENPLTRAKIELGRQLFFDPRLSGDGSVSCASCHDPDHGYAAPTRFGVGVDKKEGNRNSPTVINRLLSSSQFLDGRAGTLDAQAIGPITNPIEMASTHEQCVETLSSVPGYRLQFEHLFAEGLTIENVGRAIASFERVILTGPSAWDHHQRLATFEAAYEEELEDGEAEIIAEREALAALAASQPLSESAQRGAELFFGEASCSKCHVGANFTDEQHHNLGVGLSSDVDPGDTLIDWGRFTVTGEASDRGAFKTPTLRNVAQTAPYLHDGSLKTLAEVVAFYTDGGQENPWLSDKIAPLELGAQEQADLVAFLESLTGELPRVERERLPE